MIGPADRVILRDLAVRVAEIAALPVMAERRELWCRHNALQPVRPMILVFPEGSWQELLPAEALRCEEPQARAMERDLRQRIYGFEHFDSDNVVTADWVVPKAIHNSGWGLTARHTSSTTERGAWAFDPVINEPGDLNLLRLPEITHDEAASAQRLAAAQELFGDLLDVQLRGIAHISFHLMNLYTGWRGLEQVMMDMYAEPDMLHDAMAFLEEGYRRTVEQYSALGLLELNHDNTYHSTGGNGWLEQAPSGGDGTTPVTPADMWASAESQEMSEVSPEFHREFVMEYEKRLLAPFALTGYGCCEALHHKLDDVFTVPGIRRISMSPFADVERAAPIVQDRAIFSWKPQPSHLVGTFNPELVQGYLQHGIDATEGCVLEIILKDTHTCERRPERFDAWTRICRELVDRKSGQ
ncbi:MAG: hypothetical protein HUU35_06665 [Armatimonadetes bacterium]|nr:hypothetical protein [Armatimonadota bacterium]